MMNIFSEVCFVGDLASPDWSPINLKPFNEWLGTRGLIVNLEGPVLSTFKQPSRYISKTKYHLANDVNGLSEFKNGQVLFSVANNHYEDFPKSCCVSDAEIGHPIAGTTDRWIHSFLLNGRKTIVVCISFPATNPLRWRRSACCFSPTQALEIVLAIRAAEPDAFIVIYVHWGYELCSLPYPADRAWARAVAAGGIDAVIGHHPHIPQPIEWIGNTLVAYSLGNFFLPEGEWFGKRLAYKSIKPSGLGIAHNGERMRLFRIFEHQETRQVLAEYLTEDESTQYTAQYTGMTDENYALYFTEMAKKRTIEFQSGVAIVESYSKGLGLYGAYVTVAQDCRQLIRNILIRAGIHRPYNRS
jgi:hypothetical protein